MKMKTTIIMEVTPEKELHRQQESATEEFVW